MRLLVGLLMPDRGRILIDGKDLWEYPHLLELKRDLGFLPNEHYFFAKLTGRENLEYLSLLKTGDRDAWRALDGIGRRLDMEEPLQRPFADYSTGMRKKVQLMGALIGDPAILVLDEPMGGLDVLANIVLRRLLLELRDRGQNSVRLQPLGRGVRRCGRPAADHRGGPHRAHRDGSLPRQSSGPVPRSTRLVVGVAPVTRPRSGPTLRVSGCTAA